MQSKINERQAIDNLTKQTDYRGLCAHIIAAIGQVAGAAASLFEAHDESGRTQLEATEIDKLLLRKFPDHDDLAHPDWLANAVEQLEKALDTKYISMPTQEECIFPIEELNGVWRFLHVAAKLDEEQLDAVEHLVLIFSNLLRVLDRFERDALTGLLNRQSFDYRFEDLLEHHQRNPRRVKVDSMPWLAIADIDRFKRINDTHGHLFGDEILLLTARLMQECFRFDDLLFRYGGEEFIVILNNTDAVGAELALERFRNKIAEYSFPTIGEVTLSIGWSAVMPKEPANSIIHRADQALYQAKSLGRNRTVSYERSFPQDIEAQKSEIDLFD